MHVAEQYLTYPCNASLQDRQAEAVWHTLIEIGPRTLTNLTDYDARATLMWCATAALNRHLGCGVAQDWASHLIGHELTAFYGLAHAETLAIVFPARMRYDLARKQTKLAQFARRIWGVDTEDDRNAALAGISRTVEFLNSLGMPTELSHYHIDAEEAAQRVRDRFLEREFVTGEHKDIDGHAAAEILKNCG
jgi:NADP-dependent alcohol dehydrogenase